MFREPFFCQFYDLIQGAGLLEEVGCSWNHSKPLWALKLGQGRLIEREYLPPMGRFVLNMSKEFIEDDNDLRRRIGDADGSVAKLSDILGDYDIKFIGSRVEGTRADDLAADKKQRQHQKRDYFGRKMLAIGANFTNSLQCIDLKVVGSGSIITEVGHL